MASQDLFVELGVEELPASYVMPAAQQLSDALLKRMEEALIEHGEIEVFATPRRVGLAIAGIAEKGKDREREEFGPPVKVAFDENGEPRVPAQKFAEKVGKALDEIERREKDGKGEYLVAQVVDPGVVSRDFFAQVLPEVFSQLHFPKTMRWGRETTAFARPVQWFCVLFGGEVLPCTFAGIESSNQSYGHRFLAPDAFEVTSFAQFKEACGEKYVVLSPDERRRIIAEGAQKIATEAGGQLWEDEELLDVNSQLSEYPIPILASFDEKYLELPAEVLRTSMRQHQKCFVVVDDKGKLLPYFIPVAGLPSTNPKKVRGGYQRVLRARLDDAQFFFDEDRKEPLEALTPRLDRVIYQKDLGSYGDKVRRVAAQVKEVAQELGLADAQEASHRAAQLYKADLNSNMVYEFPELQGVMGRVYALHSGESPEVADAILEHYLPAGADDDPPETAAGQVLAIAERLDTLVGGFGVGLRPTGSTDPYGLRRQAITLLRILKEKQLPGRLAPLLKMAAAPLAEHIGEQEAVCKEVLGYLRDRLPQIFAQDGWSRDLIDAVCVDELIGRYPLHQLDQLFNALQNAVQSGLLARLAYSFKRINNILRQGVKKIEEQDPLLAGLSEEQRQTIASYEGLGTLTFREGAPEVDVTLFDKEKQQEAALYEVVRKVQSTVDSSLKEAQFGEALEALLTLREPIDDMFDHVMVMAKDADLLVNRLTMLRGIARLAFIDFSKIDTTEVEGER